MTAPAADDAWNTTARADPAAAAGAGFRVFRRRYPALLRAWLVPGLATLAVALLLTYLLSALGLPEDVVTRSVGSQNPLTPEESMRYLGAALPVAFVTYVATFLGWALVARVVVRAIDPDAEIAPLRWGAILGLAALLVLLYALGLALVVVGFLVFFHWFLFAPALAATGGRGPGDALEASRRFTKERRTYGFTALVILLSLGVSLLATLLGSALTDFVAFIGVPAAYAGAVGGSLGQWALAPLVPALPAAFVALAGREARAANAAALVDEEAAAQEGAPPREPTPAERFRTTKCPQCGTLVPYSATGKPVDVTCPVCGRAGRVL